MPRMRTIKPEFFRSESISQMPLRTRLTYIGLWTECDDHGRMRDNTRLIKGAIWPLDNFTPKDIEADLETLVAQGKIVRYEVNGRRYLAITNWDDHQAAAYRRGEARHPGPSEGVVQENASSTTESANGTTTSRDPDGMSSKSGHMGAVQKDANRTTSRAGTGNREQGTGTPSSASADGARFDEFWSVYPRRVGKKAARRKWDVAVKDADPDTIIAAAKLYAEQVQTSRTEERFIAHPETWLNKGRWDDQLAAAESEVSPLWRGAYQ